MSVPENLSTLAAAGELLDALRDLNDACEYWDNQDDPVLVAARNAIAKATTPPAASALTPRELATVLAALRQLQRTTVMVARSLDGSAWQRTGLKGGIEDIITDGGLFQPLTDDEIDALCERLNA